jgi:hypothetical protein
MSEKREDAIMKEKRSGCDGETDKRILTRMLLDGEITEKDLQAYLKELPDVSSCADEIEIE